MLDENLNFKRHLQYVNKKVARKIYYCMRMNRNLSIDCKLRLYKAVIAPHFDYCATLLYQMYDCDLKTTQIIQNRALRSILGCNRYTPINYMLNMLKVLNIKERIFYNTMNFIRKMRSNNLPRYLTESVTLTQDMHEYNTRYSSRNCLYTSFGE